MDNKEEIKYEPQSIEEKWEKYWEEKKIFSPDLDKALKPFYNLMMFPYPSAEGLHVGNMYAFTGADVYGRFKRMQGNAVFEPIGLDGFGIHSENYALKVGTHPVEQSKKSEANFYRQLRLTGNAYDWIRTVETYNPNYYKWTQWIFTQLFKNGLAVRKKAPVNFCPSCKTVLSDEQVINGKCERCETVVEKGSLEQWFFKITDYAQRLLDNLEKIDWSEKVKIAQKNWIGRSEGARIEFEIENFKDKIEVFTTRPDTLFGVTFMVLAPENPLIEKILKQVEGKKKKEIEEYIDKAKKKTETDRIAEGKEKTGVFTGIYAINPVNNEKIPIWIADYVVMGYGTGAIMAVPAHYQRDFEFAKKYDLPIKQVILPVVVDTENPPRKGEENTQRNIVNCFLLHPKDEKIIALRSKKFPWLTPIVGGIENGEDAVAAGIREIKEETGYKNFKLIGRLPFVVQAEFFARHKNVNRKVISHMLIFKLENEEKDEVSSKENALHALEWVDIKDLGKLHPFSEKQFIAKWFENGDYAYTGEGLLINSPEFNDIASYTAKDSIIQFIKGKKEVHYHLRDWLISRQRYWGAPIPMIYCENCAGKGKSWFNTEEAKQLKINKKGLFVNLTSGNVAGWPARLASESVAGWYPVPDDQLPIELPYIKDFKPLGTGVSPLANHPDFYKTKCPECGSEAKRETDVSDTFLDSAWYFFRYTSTDIQNEAFDKKRVKNWLPVDMYIGGAEHAVLHLLYSRFMTMFLNDLGLIDFEEPYKKFYAHGLLIKEGAKMSKSRGNIINPDEYIQKYGSDTLRMYLMFLGPFDMGGDFYDSGIEGMARFVKRIWHLVVSRLSLVDLDVKDQRSLTNERLSFMHKTIKKVTEDIEALRYNTAIAALMEWYNFLSEELKTHPPAGGSKLKTEEAETFLKLLAPFAPFITEELYQKLNKENDKPFDSIHLQSWPKYDEKYLIKDQTTVVIQINGKRRGELKINSNQLSDRQQIEKTAAEQTKKHLEGKEIKKVVYVPGKIINFVI